MTGEFFKLNDRKLESLIKATTDDMKKAERAVLRMANDQYQKTIFNAQVYANGACHTLSDYADMALRTASKRAYLQGEGEKRQEWGISTVIVNKRGNPCPKCLPFVGKVMIDDVWSGGKPEDGPYPLMSTAVEHGLYHPNCKDSHTTYFKGISTADDAWTKEELEKIGQNYRQDQKLQYAARQAKKYDRMAKYSLDEENQKRYKQKCEDWKAVASSVSSDIINISETKEVIEVHSIGKIDKEIYKCITEDIGTDEVIITDERIQHIVERHPNDYERYCAYLKEIVENPDYIVESNKPNTALILKEIAESEEKQFKTILRLKTSKDNKGYKNSIITFMKINEKEWSRLLRNKQILYKRE